MGISYVVESLAYSLPLLVVYLLGMGLAISQASRLPRVALCGGGGFAVLMIATLVRPFVMFLIFRVAGGGGSALNWTILNAITSVIFVLIEAAAMGTIIYAIFADRSRSTSPAGSPPAPQQPPKAW